MLKYYLLLPVNYRKLKEENIVEGLDELIKNEPEKYYLESESLLFCFDPKFHQVTDQLINWLKEEPKASIKKIYLEVIFNMLSIFHTEKLSYFIFIHFENILRFLITLNVSHFSHEIAVSLYYIYRLLSIRVKHGPICT